MPETVSHERTDLHLDSAGISGFRELVRVNFTDSERMIAPHRHLDAVEICYITKGEQVYEAQGCEYVIKSGYGFISHPSELHSSANCLQQKNVQLYYMIIDTVNDLGCFLGLNDAEAAKQLVDAVNRLPHRFYIGDELKAKLDNMFDLYINRPFLWQTQLKCASFDMLRTLIINAVKPQIQQEVSLYTLRALNFIEDNIFEVEKLNIQNIANYVGLSIPQFIDHFRRDTGSAPRKYINKRRMQLAEEMLLKGNRITDVAFALGFSSSQHFSNMFRSYYQYSPSKWLLQQHSDS